MVKLSLLFNAIHDTRYAMAGDTASFDLSGSAGVQTLRECRLAPILI